MAVVQPILAVVSPLRVLFYGVDFALLGTLLMMHWSDREWSRLRREAFGRRGPRKSIRIERLAESGQLIPLAEAVDVRRVVEGNLRLWRSPRQRLANRVALATVLWWFGVPAMLWGLRGRWGPLAVFVVILILLFALRRYLVRRQGRLRRTAQANGWLVNGQLADAP